jgi:hypothetical protein
VTSIRVLWETSTPRRNWRLGSAERVAFATISPKMVPRIVGNRRESIGNAKRPPDLRGEISCRLTKRCRSNCRLSRKAS